jgi:hypothetical protein
VITLQGTSSINQGAGMITMKTDSKDIGSQVTIQGKSGTVVGREDVGPGDSIRRSAGLNLLVRFEDGSDKWVRAEGSTK